MLRRYHWLEIHEQTWCPNFLRTYVQDLLRWFWENLRLVDSVTPILAKALKATDATHIVDLCSGGGGPHAVLVPALQKELNVVKLKMTLTDLFPHVEAWKEISAKVPDVVYVAESVDATNVPQSLRGFRTLFTCLHHFDATLVQNILQDAVDKSEGIAVFEITDRTWPYIIFFALSVPVLGAINAVSRPYSLRNFVLGTIVPVGTLLNLHDGTTSNLRTYTPAEMQAIIDRLKGVDAYTWEVGKRRLSPFTPAFMTAPYLIGTPKKKAD